jgi:GxxExxY protein
MTVWLVENKAVPALSSTHIAQLLTYLRLGDYRVGLLLNWNTILIKHGIKRVANGF